MAGGYFSDDQNDKMKTLLYPYLMDKFQRRAQQTSGAAYDAREAGYRQDEDNADARGLVSVLGDSASMAGTLQGKRSDVGQLPKYMDQLTENDQQRNANLFKERNAEENSLGTDLNVAKFVGDEDYKDKDLKARTADREAERQGRAAAAAAAAKLKADEDRIRDQHWQADYSQRGDIAGGRLKVENGRLALDRDKMNKPTNPAMQGPGGIVPGYVDADGNPLTYNPKTGASGSLKLPPGAKPTKTPGAEKITDQERNSSMFYANANQALGQLEDMETKGYKPGAFTALKDKFTPSGLESYTLSPDEQRYKQAAEDFTAAKLRLESGAAIPQSEIAQQARIYMIQPGDSPEVIAQKKASRRQAVEGLKFKAGPGADKISQGGGQAASGKTVVKELHSPSTGKIKRIYSDGSEEVLDGPR